jgi:carbonic anhydrase/acetyltransferase-like protein (isoleucine patch superfamily)
MAIYELDGATPRIHPDAVVIGDVTVGAGASVWPGAVLRGAITGAL